MPRRLAAASTPPVAASTPPAAASTPGRSTRIVAQLKEDRADTPAATGVSLEFSFDWESHE
ncbi:hypothetical protein [Agromyces bauzanensis]